MEKKQTKKKKKRSNRREAHIKYTMRTIHENFTSNLEGLGVFVNTIAPVAIEHDQISQKKREEIFKSAFEIIGVDEEVLDKKKEILFEATDKQMENFMEKLRELRGLTSIHLGLLYRSSFVILICYFEYLISDLIHFYFQTYPESLSGKELNLSLGELKQCSDLDEAVDILINKEVENVLYMNLQGQRKYLKDKLKVDMQEDLINWSRIDEAVERRNIIVHNDSKINKRYLKNVDISFAPEKARNLKEGARISMPEEYFKIVFDEILVAGTILIHVCWRKWVKNEIKIADGTLNDIDIMGALNREQWLLAERIGLFSKQCKAFDESQRLHWVINYCQTLKWQGKEKELKNELDKLDESALSPKYKCAIYALKSDKDRFYESVDNAIGVDDLKKSAFISWPLFREMREDSNYEEIIEKAFASVAERKQE